MIGNRRSIRELRPGRGTHIATTTGRAATTGPHLWDRVSVRQFAAVPACVRDARRHAAGLVQAWGLAGVAESTELLVSELATNATRASDHTGGQDWQDMSMPAPERMALRLTSTTENLVIEMWDGTTTPPVRKAPELDAEGGRGLLLVDALSQDWGYYRPWAGGKVVWCALRLTESSVSLAGGRVVPPGAPPDRHSETLLEPGLPMETTETADDRQWLRRVVDGLRELGGWYLPVEDDNDNDNDNDNDEDEDDNDEDDNGGDDNDDESDGSILR